MLNLPVEAPAPSNVTSIFGRPSDKHWPAWAKTMMFEYFYENVFFLSEKRLLSQIDLERCHIAAAAFKDILAKPDAPAPLRLFAHEWCVKIDAHIRTLTT